MGAEKKEDGGIPSRDELDHAIGSESGESYLALQDNFHHAEVSGDLDLALIFLRELTAITSEDLRLEMLWNQHYEPPKDVLPTVHGLVNLLLSEANLWEKKGYLRLGKRLESYALRLSMEYMGPSDRADVGRFLASAYLSQGRFNEALATLASSRDAFEEVKDSVRLAETCVDMADVLQWLGDSARALVELERASKMMAPLIPRGAPTWEDVLASIKQESDRAASGEGPDTGGVHLMSVFNASLLIDFQKGQVYKALGNYEAAEQFLRKAQPRVTSLGMGLVIESLLASILVAKGRWKEGLAAAKRLEPEIEKSDILGRRLAAILLTEAEALIKLERLDEALDKLQRGIEDLTVYSYPDLLWRSQWLKGKALQGAGKKEQALAAYAEAIGTVNGLRKAPLGYRLDSTYLNDKLELFRGAISLASECGSPQECCEFLEMIKSHTLSITLSFPSKYAPGTSDELGALFDDMSRKLDALEYAGYKDGVTEELRKAKEALQAERDALQERIQLSNPRWRAMTGPVPFDFAKVANVLSARGQAALSMFYEPNRITAVLVDEGGSAVSTIEVPPDVAAGLETYARNLAADRPDPLLYDLSSGLAIGARHLLPENLLTRALRSRGLIVVPHGPLHLVPWAGLIFKGKRLFEYSPVGILPNLGCMQKLEADFSAVPEIALLGAPDYSKLSLPPLPSAQKELSEIERLYRSGSKVIEPVLTGEHANEWESRDLMESENAKGAILHIACHGTYEPNEPMNSGLLLTNSKLDAAEVSRLKLGFNEVVLSACSTGSRPTKVKDVVLSGDDIVGLPGAFLEAGVSSVLVSIPRADDDAALQFMTLYHQNRLTGRSPLAALQETQKAMLRRSTAAGEDNLWKWIGFTAYGCQ